MQQAMSNCLDAVNKNEALGQDCEKALRRDFQKRLTISIVCVALGVIGVLTQ